MPHDPKHPSDQEPVAPRVRSLAPRFESVAEPERCTRDDDPVEQAEAELARIQGTEAACLFASGVDATNTAILAYLHAGEEVLSARAVPGGASRFLRHLVPRLGFASRLVDGASLVDPTTLRDETRVVYFATPENPTLRILDARAIARTAAAQGAVSVVDSTFAPPPIQTQADLGADLVVHLVTGYLNGRSDLPGGVVLGTRARVEPVRKLRRAGGAILGPDHARALLGGLKTLESRIERHQATARTLAERLQADARITSVTYPGLASHPDHALALTRMHGAGAMLSFSVTGGRGVASRVFEALRPIKGTVSTGELESRAMLPGLESRVVLPGAEPVDPGRIHLSVGLESAEALWAKLDRALGRTDP